MRRVDGAADILSGTLPRVLGKGGLMLFLTQPEAGAFKVVCQVTGSAVTRLTGKDVAAIVAPSFSAHEPTPGPGIYKEDDYTLWTVAPDMTLQAGVSVYRRKVRTISISVRQAR